MLVEREKGRDAAASAVPWGLAVAQCTPWLGCRGGLGAGPVLPRWPGDQGSHTTVHGPSDPSQPPQRKMEPKSSAQRPRRPHEALWTPWGLKAHWPLPPETPRGDSTQESHKQPTGPTHMWSAHVLPKGSSWRKRSRPGAQRDGEPACGAPAPLPGQCSRGFHSCGPHAAAGTVTCHVPAVVGERVAQPASASCRAPCATTSP